MNPTPELNAELQKVALLETINKALERLGSMGRWKVLPDWLLEYEPLKGKTILMLDDVKIVLESFIPFLMVATQGKTSFIKYDAQELEELIQEIMAQHPDIILLDYHLAEYFKGSQVAMALQEQKFSGLVVGFSSDNDIKRDFERAGVTEVLEKSGGGPEKSIKELAQLVVRITQK